MPADTSTSLTCSRKTLDAWGSWWGIGVESIVVGMESYPTMRATSSTRSSSIDISDRQ